MLLPWCILMILKKSSMKHLQTVSERFRVKTSDVMCWSTVLGHSGKGACNSNEEILLSFCAEQQMTVSNTLFQMPDKCFYSKAPRAIIYWTLTPRRLRPTREANKTQTRDPLSTLGLVRQIGRLLLSSNSKIRGCSLSQITGDTWR